MQGLKYAYRVAVVDEETGMKQIFERSDLEDEFNKVINEEKIDIGKYGIRFKSSSGN